MLAPLRYLIAINSIFVFGLQMFAPFFAIFITHLTSDLWHVGAISGVFIFLTAVFTYVLRDYQNEPDRAWLFLVAGFVLRGLMAAAYAFSTQLWHIYAINIVLAFAESCGSPAYQALFIGNVNPKRPASEWGLASSINSVVLGIAAFTGSFLFASGGFQLLLACMFVLSFASAFLALRYRGELIGHAHPSTPLPIPVR